MAIKLINVCGARPNFMKIAPLMDAYKDIPEIDPVLVHTGQHYDEKMSDLFFRQLGIPEPDINLEVGSGSHAQQTGSIMQKFEPVVTEHKPDAVLVVGDVNSTIACAMVACKLGVKVIHVEAGLRSFDRTMPEEINRILTDSISDFLFVTEPSGVENLRNEGIDDGRVHLVGNVMIDTVLKNQQRASESTVLNDLGIQPRQYGLVTMHRPATVDDPAKLSAVIEALGEISNDIELIFAVHPRTRKNITGQGLDGVVEKFPRLRLTEPFGYLEFLKLMGNAVVVLTDSGGMQEETTILQVPCLTLRENTERPATIEWGTNRLVDPEKQAVLDAWTGVRDNPPPNDRKPPMWDGQAAQRIAKILGENL